MPVEKLKSLIGEINKWSDSDTIIEEQWLINKKCISLKVKRIVDIFSALIGLIVLSPLFAVVAILIKLDSRGPIIFKQKRVGRNGKLFTFYKFRSMIDNNDDTAHIDYAKKYIMNEAEKYKNGKEKVYKIIGDPRITMVGSWLRKTSIDELPQLFNVLKGEMSLVGPRPPLPYEVEIDKDTQMKRLVIIPGITGLWQVTGRCVLSYREAIELDFEYIKNWSLWLDLKILIKTIPVVLLRKGVG